MEYPVKSDGLVFVAATDVEAATEYGSDKQRKRDGVPVWEMRLLVLAGGREHDTLRVRVAAQGKPEITQGQPVEVAGLRIVTYEMSGTAGYSCWVDAARVLGGAAPAASSAGSPASGGGTGGGTAGRAGSAGAAKNPAGGA